MRTGSGIIRMADVLGSLRELTHFSKKASQLKIPSRDFRDK